MIGGATVGRLRRINRRSSIAMGHRGSRAIWSLGALALGLTFFGCRATAPNRVRETLAEVRRSRADAEVEALLREIAAREAALDSNRRQARELELDLDVAVERRKDRAKALSEALTLVEALEQDLAAAQGRSEEIRQAKALLEAQAKELADRDARVVELEKAIEDRAARIAALEAELEAGAAAIAAREAELGQRKAELLERLQKLDAVLAADLPPAPAEEPPAAGGTETPPAKGDGSP